MMALMSNCSLMDCTHFNPKATSVIIRKMIEKASIFT